MNGLKILFICTHNRCRSILAEAISNQLAGGELEARSAGSEPAGQVHPLSLSFLKQAGYSVENLKSQAIDDHQGWQPDVVITVCDTAAREACPVWLGKAVKVHWGLQDPSSVSGSDAQVADAFRETINILENRIRSLLKLNPGELDSGALECALHKLGV